MKDTLLLSYTSQDYFLIIYSLFFRLDNFFHCSIIMFTDLSSFISILLLSLSSDFFFYIFVTNFSSKFPFDSFLYLLFADESLLRLSIFPPFQECSPLLLGTVLAYSLCPIISTSVSSQCCHFWSPFPTGAAIFLVLCTLGDFGLYSGHFEYCLMRPLLLFKSCGESLYFGFSRQFSVSGCKFQAAFCGLWFQHQFSFQAFAVLFRSVPCSGQSGTWVVILSHTSVLRVCGQIHMWEAWDAPWSSQTALCSLSPTPLPLHRLLSISSSLGLPCSVFWQKPGTLSPYLMRTSCNCDCEKKGQQEDREEELSGHLCTVFRLWSSDWRRRSLSLGVLGTLRPLLSPWPLPPPWNDLGAGTQDKRGKHAYFSLLWAPSCSLSLK